MLALTNGIFNDNRGCSPSVNLATGVVSFILSGAWRFCVSCGIRRYSENVRETSSMIFAINTSLNGESAGYCAGVVFVYKV